MSCLKSWVQSGDEKLLGTKCQRKIVEVLKWKKLVYLYGRKAYLMLIIFNNDGSNVFTTIQRGMWTLSLKVRTLSSYN